MSTKKNKYWKGAEELYKSKDFEANKHKEFNEYIPVEDFVADKEVMESSSTNRRDFLKYLGFGVTAASLAACETPVTKAIPYVVKPEKINAGVPVWYASTYDDGNDFCHIMVKTREGRPIKIEGNKSSKVTKGAINARVNSSVLGLYDNQRYKAPMMAGAETTWSTFDKELKAELEDIASKGGKIRIVTPSINSPSTKKLIGEFMASLEGADVKHITYDAISYSGMLKAHQSAFGKLAIPSYDFSKAKTIVGIGADFLNSFPSSIEYSKGYGISRNPDKDWMSKHYQFESVYSLTGSNADYRTPIKPSEHAQVIAALYGMISGSSYSKTAYDAKIKKAADELKRNAGESIVISGSNDENVQQLVIAINQALGNYGKTLDIQNESRLRSGLDSDIIELSKEMNAGNVDAVLSIDTDPIYTLPASLKFQEGYKKVPTTVTFTTRPTRTSINSKYVAATNHYLESWNDHNPKKGSYSISQPVIRELFDTRQAQDVLLRLMGNRTSYYEYLRSNWTSDNFTASNSFLNADDFWNKSVQAGLVAEGISPKADTADTTSASAATNEGTYTDGSSNALRNISKTSGSEWEIELYQKVGIGNGKQAFNPWLQELPDPLSKMTWDNYITMNPSDARDKGFNIEYGEKKEASMINLTVNGITLEAVPVIALPGQAKGTLGLALGYGQTIGAENMVIGVNAYPFTTVNNDSLLFHSSDVSFEANGKTYPVATTQTHSTIMGRESIIRETDFNTYQTADQEAYNPPHMMATPTGMKPTDDVDIWAKHPIEEVGHRWGMSIDLNLCIGCGSCVTSCTAENNVPIVGKDEVRRSREMHWIRIDRYFSAEEHEDPDADILKEDVEDNPRVVFQPMLCQHCNHAPCETVCPVAATTHSDEGLNQMTYNRCIGTRYCANNCPYKVRRFNWFNYMEYDKFTQINPAQDDLGRMVLNPDVTVRSRGVMEKCSMCVQRIQYGKLEAKKAGRKVMDGDIETACASACPTNAIVFGDLNDKSTLVRNNADSKRAYRVIEEIGTEPNIYYQVKVRNIESNQV